jgi:hypothetical protein
VIDPPTSPEDVAVLADLHAALCVRYPGPWRHASGTPNVRGVIRDAHDRVVVQMLEDDAEGAPMIRFILLAITTLPGLFFAHRCLTDWADESAAVAEVLRLTAEVAALRQSLSRAVAINQGGVQ